MKRLSGLFLLLLVGNLVSDPQALTSIGNKSGQFFENDTVDLDVDAKGTGKNSSDDPGFLPARITEWEATWNYNAFCLTPQLFVNYTAFSEYIRGPPSFSLNNHEV